MTDRETAQSTAEHQKQRCVELLTDIEVAVHSGEIQHLVIVSLKPNHNPVVSVTGNIPLAPALGGLEIAKQHLLEMVFQQVDIVPGSEPIEG